MKALKYMGLLAILSLFTVALTIDYIGEADATPQSRGDITNEPVEPSIRAQQKANAEVETQPEAPRSESNYKRPAGEAVEPSIKAQQRAQAVPEFKVDASPLLEQMSVTDFATKSGKDFVVTGDVTSFTAAYLVVNPANIDMRNVEILVTSDTESVRGELTGSYDEKHRIISVMIDAVDPASINAKITGF